MYILYNDKGIMGRLDNIVFIKKRDHINRKFRRIGEYLNNNITYLRNI